MKSEHTDPSPDNRNDYHANWLDCFNSEKDSLVLLPVSPLSLLAYWQWTPAKTEAFRGAKLKGDLVLRLFNAEDKSPAAEFPCRWDGLKMYVKPPEGRRGYYAVLSVPSDSGSLQTLLESNIAVVPSGRPAAAGEERIPGSSERFRRSAS